MDILELPDVDVVLELKFFKKKYEDLLVLNAELNRTIKELENMLEKADEYIAGIDW